MDESENRRAFFLEMSENARTCGCFIYNSGKDIKLKTKCLEGADRSGLSHTGWALTESYISFNLYTVKSSDTAIGKMEMAENDRRFRELEANKEGIERTFGEPLRWDYKPGRTVQRIRSFTSEEATEANREKWLQIQADLIRRTTKLREALLPFLQKLA